MSGSLLPPTLPATTLNHQKAVVGSVHLKSLSVLLVKRFSFNEQHPWVGWHRSAAVAWEDPDILDFFNAQSTWTSPSSLRK